MHFQHFCTLKNFFYAIMIIFRCLNHYKMQHTHTYTHVWKLPEIGLFLVQDAQKYFLGQCIDIKKSFLWIKLLMHKTALKLELTNAQKVACVFFQYFHENSNELNNIALVLVWRIWEALLLKQCPSERRYFWNDAAWKVKKFKNRGEFLALRTILLEKVETWGVYKNK